MMDYCMPGKLFRDLQQTSGQGQRALIRSANWHIMYSIRDHTSAQPVRRRSNAKIAIVKTL